MTQETQDYKRQAAAQALQLVEADMVLGLGSGSTALAFVELLAERIKEENLHDYLHRDFGADARIRGAARDQDRRFQHDLRSGPHGGWRGRNRSSAEFAQRRRRRAPARENCRHGVRPCLHHCGQLEAGPAAWRVSVAGRDRGFRPRGHDRHDRNGSRGRRVQRRGQASPHRLWRPISHRWRASDRRLRVWRDTGCGNLGGFARYRSGSHGTWALPRHSR